MVTKVVLITGANAGVGYECARQLALKDGIEKVILGCRSQSKAKEARSTLEEKTGKKIFDILIIDVSDLDSVRKAVQGLDGTIDALVMNAGGFASLDLAPSGVTKITAVNVLGHVLLFDLLLEQKKLVDSSTVLYVSSEVCRGIPGAPGYQFKDEGSITEFKSLCDGSGLDKALTEEQCYGITKLVGTLWILGMAKKYPHARIFAVSPGATRGTNATSNFHPVKHFIFEYIMLPLLGLLGRFHSVEYGSKRYVDVLYNEEKYDKSGVFYASKTAWPTGEMGDQIEHAKFFGDARYQENANVAIHSFFK